jgi:hypothetical protein
MSFNSNEEPLIFLKKILDDAVPGEYIVEARWNAACTIASFPVARRSGKGSDSKWGDVEESLGR